MMVQSLQCCFARYQADQMHCCCRCITTDGTQGPVIPLQIQASASRLTNRSPSPRQRTTAVDNMRVGNRGKHTQRVDGHIYSYCDR